MSRQPVVTEVPIPPKAIPAFSQHYRHIGLVGGRGSAKSFTAHLMGAIDGYAKPMRILCVREFQNSLKESSMAQVIACINEYKWLKNHYEVGETYIRGRNGTEFLFSGLSRNIESVKSLVDIDLVIAEEAEQLSQKSLEQLIPTIRKAGSKFIWVWNPELKGSPIDQLMIQNPPEDSIVIRLNHSDNPWFTKELEAERRHHQKHYPSTYANVWEGDYKQSSETNPFINLTIEPKSFSDLSQYDVNKMHRVISIDYSTCVGRDYFVMAEQGRDFQGDTHLIDLYRTKDASIDERLAKVAEWIKRRRPEVLVIERNTDSITFIDVLQRYLREEDIRIKIEDPSASSRGNKESYIVNWLQPIFNDNAYHCISPTYSDIIRTEMNNFSLDSKSNADDTLDAIASGVRYLRTPEPVKEEVMVTTNRLSDERRQKLQNALRGNKGPSRRNFT